MTNIVVLTHNRYRLTKQCLDSLYTTTPRDQFCLTIVDDGSTDFRTRALVHDYSTKVANCCAVTVQSSGHDLGRLKNLGVEWSRQRFGEGGWLCLADNDCCFLPNWHQTMSNYATNTYTKNFRLWGGQQHPYHHPIDGTAELTYPEYAALPGTHWFMEWLAWDEWGPLVSEGPGVCRSEDAAFCTRLREAGFKIGVSDPRCVADCGLTNSEGNPQPGAELRTERVTGVIYE